MVCNLCGAQEATIHLTEIVNNQMLEVHLCEGCAKEKGTDFKTHFNLTDLLAGVLGESEKPLKGPMDKRLAGRCPDCGITYDEFAKAGRLGCAGCYDAFSKLLLPLIKKIQKALVHVGKRPQSQSTPAGPARKPSSPASDLRMLQERLRKSVQNEAFEDAAQLRDEIKQLEDKLKKGKKNKSE